jgi:erythromycin esterase-like protein
MRTAVETVVSVRNTRGEDLNPAPASMPTLSQTLRAPLIERRNIMARRFRIGWEESDVSRSLLDEVGSLSRPLNGAEDLDPLLDRVGDSRIVLLGEASHGTADYYDWRDRITRRLIQEKGFSFIAVEGDWPACLRASRFAEGSPDSQDRTPEQALAGFERWPTWMWANREIARLLAWLRQTNEKRPEAERVGFYGLDVYSLWESMDAVLGYLKRQGDEEALDAAMQAFECFEPYGRDEQEYASSLRWSPDSCEEDVVRLLTELQSRGPSGTDRLSKFDAEQNALVARNAERYYRTMIRGGSEPRRDDGMDEADNSWNVRDRHMMETLERLLAFHGPSSKAIVWEHNTHVGDARYTDMKADGSINVGQLARERHGEKEVFIVGFSSHQGSVIAGRSWGAPLEQMVVPPGRPGSWEDVLHQAAPGDKLLMFKGGETSAAMQEMRGHRAIGVVYRPEHEAFGNYVPTVLPRRYDALLYLDQTRALHPLHDESYDEHEVPETFPTGL